MFFNWITEIVNLVYVALFCMILPTGWPYAIDDVRNQELTKN